MTEFKNPLQVKSNEIKWLDNDINSEPLIALDGGNDGLDVIKKLSTKLKKFKINGLLALEIQWQYKNVSKILRKITL